MTDQPIHEGEGKKGHDVIVVVASPALNEVLQHQGGVPTDRVAYNDGFSVAAEGDSKFAAKDAVQIGNVYAVAYKGLPDAGYGSKDDVRDAIAWYQEQPQYQMNRDFNNQVQSALQSA
jgi:hypothetical protein